MARGLKLSNRLSVDGGAVARRYLQPISRVFHADAVTAGSMQSNTRIPMVNNTGRALDPADDEVWLIFANFSYTASLEYSPTSTLTVRAGM
jgi:hypothetical protein